jgi:hypothetical protein
MIKLKSLIVEQKTEQKFIVYHGTGTRFRKFNLKKSAQGIIWFTSKKENITSGDGIGAAGKGFIITAEVTFKKAAGWREYTDFGFWELEQYGFDGCILPNDHGFDCFVFSPDQIKILKIEKV